MEWIKHLMLLRAHVVRSSDCWQVYKLSIHFPSISIRMFTPYSHSLPLLHPIIVHAVKDASVHVKLVRMVGVSWLTSVRHRIAIDNAATLWKRISNQSGHQCTAVLLPTRHHTANTPSQVLSLGKLELQPHRTSSARQRYLHKPL